MSFSDLSIESIPPAAHIQEAARAQHGDAAAVVREEPPRRDAHALSRIAASPPQRYFANGRSQAARLTVCSHTVPIHSMTLSRPVLSLLLVALVGKPSFTSAASVTEEKIEAQELAEELGLHARRIVFSFARPVYARADFVTIHGGQTVRSPIAIDKPQSKIEFAYILHPPAEKSTAITLRLGQQKVHDHFRGVPSPSAIPHDLYPPISVPAELSAAKPVYIFLHWDPVMDDSIKYDMAPRDIAGKITEGYYVALYFSEGPFPKP
jgi:hypothetical protein